MTLLTPEIAADVVAQCQVAAGEIGQAFNRAFGAPFEATIGGPGSLRLLDGPDGLESPGIVVALFFGHAAMAILIPRSGGVLPPGYDAGDAKAQSKLTTLAQELGMLVLPESLMADDAQGFCVKNLAEALRDGGAADSATLVPLLLKSAGKQEEALVIWPLATAHKIKKAENSAAAKATATAAEVAPKTVGDAATSALSETPDDAASAADAEVRGHSIGEPAGFTAPSMPSDDSWTAARSASKQKDTARGPSLRDLPPYSRSLLKIRVPLSVTLAEKKQPLGQILEIGPGSILQFEKSCEDMLDLNVSNLPIARGEAVKVGDKFGLRVTSVILPSERFKAVQPAVPGCLPATA